MVYIRHTATHGLFAHGVTRRTLGTHKQYLAVIRCQRFDKIARGPIHWDRLLQINNMDIISCTENIGCHFGIPVPGLVSEMDTRFQHLVHTDLSHDLLLYGLGLHTPQTTT